MLPADRRPPTPVSDAGDDDDDYDYVFDWPPPPPRSAALQFEPALDSSQVDRWLHGTYPEQDEALLLPDGDDLSLEDLQDLHQKTEEASAMMELVLQTQRQLSDENMRQAAVWQEKLDALEFSKASMSTEGSRALDALASLALRLGLDDTSLSSYQTALAQLTIDTLEAELEENELDEMGYALHGRIGNAEDELSKMKDMLASLQQRQTDQEDESLAHLLHKDTDTLRRQEAIQQQEYASVQKEYDDTDVEQLQLRLSAIMKMGQDMTSVEAALAEQNAVLGSYHDLPPDMMLATRKFKEAENRLYDLRQERESLLTDVADQIR